MPGLVRKSGISTESDETRPALCPRFRADGLQVTVADGKGIATDLTMSGVGGQDLAAPTKNFLEPRMSPDLIAREQKDGGQNDGGIP
jgi:hypothetical protein